MPSTPDVTESHESFDAPVAPADVLASVKAEGLRRRSRRHRRNGVLAALGLAIIAVPAVTLLPGDDGGRQELQVAGEGSTSDADDDGRSSPSTVEVPTTPAPSTTVTTAVPLPPPTLVMPDGTDQGGEGPATTVPRTTATTTAPQTTVPPPTTLPPPANQPLTASFLPVAGPGIAGQPVTFAVQWSDPDAQLTYDMFSADGTLLAPPCVATRGADPATPNGGSGQLSYTHTFVEPGTYVVAVALGTGDCVAPYADSTSIEMTVEVVAAGGAAGA